ncbi:MAG: UDP-glucose--hexose-1-phosphate uridylyltransferase [Eubacterium sp.]|nr:UDP-glucose--hexose-1-phosphate uridylyltransferase [Eubacterium sp.]
MQQAIWDLAQYGIETGLMEEADRTYAMNLLLDVMREAELDPLSPNRNINLEETLKILLDAAVKKELINDSITERDLFDTRLMNCLMPRPGEVQKAFAGHYEHSPKEATEYFYKLSRDSHYIRSERVKKDRRWSVDSAYGTIDISINLSKPEKNPKDIAAARNAKQADYPKCMLCMENEGYAGRINFPARQNHRIIPITIDGKKWGFQYSPYVYYNEHCIVFNGEHTPMKIDRQTFVKLFDFIKLFPHYFLGSNADLPIVGGSILTHDHFQGGHYEFAMERAEFEQEFTVPGYEDVTAGIVKWPLSVIRIRHKSPDRLIDLADHILGKWRSYTDEDAMVYAMTDGEVHNTITPIARCKDGVYELDLALRNNLTTKEHPLGLYHPHEQYHHIKRENIGLIEVMGLAVLPARLEKELSHLADAMLAGKNLREDEELEKHADWAETFSKRYETIDENNIRSIIEKEVGEVFVHVLEDAGVYKGTKEGREAFMRFVRTL